MKMAFDFDDIPASVYDSFVKEEFGHLNLKENNTSYNFICPNPDCGDITKPNKRKAYVYKDTWLYQCCKCGTKMPFPLYLKRNNEEAYQRLLFSAFGAAGRNRKDTPRKDEPKKPKNPSLPFKEGELIPITANHPLAIAGRQECMKRKIREEVWGGWFVCLHDDRFLNRDAAGNYVINQSTGRPTGNEYRNRIVIPFYHFGGKWEQFDARAIDPRVEPRYLNFAGVRRTAYNIDFVNFDEPFYVLEGTIDSTFIRNSIAIGGVSHMDEVLGDYPEIAKHKENCVFLWDNDEKGREYRLASCDLGYKWFTWEGIASKDVNAAVLAGEFPLDEDGYVDSLVLKARVRDPQAANILFTLQYGNVRKEEWKKKRDAERAVKERAARSRRVEVHF